MLVVPGTSTLELCEYLAPFILDNVDDDYVFDYTCTADGITIDG